MSSSGADDDMPPLEEIEEDPAGDVAEPSIGATERAELDAKSVRELREICRTKGIDTSSCSHKRDLVDLIISNTSDTAAPAQDGATSAGYNASRLIQSPFFHKPSFSLQSFMESFSVLPLECMATSSLASSCPGGETRIVRKWACQSTLSGHMEWVRTIAWSPCGQVLASGSGDMTIQLWDAQTGARKAKLEGHEAPILAVAYSHDGKFIASGSGYPGFNDNSIRRWDAETGASTGPRLTGHMNCVRTVAWSPCGIKIASGSDDSTIKIWQAETGQELMTLKGHLGMITALAWSPDGRKLATGGTDWTVKIWDSESGECLLTWTGHRRMVSSVCWSPNGCLLATASWDYDISIWDAWTGICLKTLKGHSKDNPECTCTHGAEGAGVIDSDPNCKVLKYPNCKVIGHSVGVNSVAWNKEGNMLASCSSDKSIIVWDAFKWQCAAKLQGHTGCVFVVSWSIDGRLASGSLDKTVKIWRPNGMTEEQQEQCVAFCMLSHARLGKCSTWTDLEAGLFRVIMRKVSVMELVG